ncbi:accessory Sec system protein Asp1 [Lacticaseibacillus paracasei]|uniref:accessory Sec system protein Asp1 n=1 Tax=Lacticaseibacillus paracasei TaxID=1597 RepID=UPI001C43ABC7|nr:accessory Sec system protein Asp1 [Lacticaseibacillus paracasei]QXJ68260.1 accessory Sec system protein Asp1 [Lacticaseibacillus paracasei subsp. paracasei]
MLTLMPTFESSTNHPETDPVVELAMLFKENDVDFSLLFSQQMPDLRRLLYHVGLENFPWVNVYDDIQQVQVKNGVPFSINDLVLPDSVTPFFLGSDVFYFRGSERVMQVHFHPGGFVYWVNQKLPEGRTMLDQYDDRGFVTTRTVTEQDGTQEKYWLNDYGNVVLTQTKEGISVSEDQQNRFTASHYSSMRDIVYEFLMRKSMRIEQSLQVITNLQPSTLELRNGQPLLRKIVFLVNQRLNLQPKDHMMLGPKDVFIFPTSADEQLFSRSSSANDPQGNLSKIETYVIPQYATKLDLGISNETSQDLVYWRLGNIHHDECRRLFLQMIKMLRNADDQALIIEGSRQQVELLKKHLEQYALTTFDIDLKSKEYQVVAKYLVDQRSGKPLAGLNNQGKKLRALPNWQALSGAESIVGRIHFQEEKRDLQEEMMHQARVYVDTATIPDLRMMILAISSGVPLIVRQESTLVRNQQNGIIIDELTEVPQACRYFLNTLRHWNNALVVNSELIEKFSANHLIQQWREIMLLGKA